MCAICSTFKDTNFLDDAEATDRALELVAGEIKKNPQTADHFKPFLDRVLGTEMADRDLEREEAWENSRRSRNNG